MAWLSQQRYESELSSEVAAFAVACGKQDLDATVATCPEWTVRDLVAHVGTAYRTVGGLVRSGMTELKGAAPVRPPMEPPADWAAWLTEGAAEFITTVRDHGFDSPIWTWQPAYPIAGFWLRRLLHDLVIHHFDADPAARVAPDLAADGIDDILGTVATLAGRGSMSGLTGDGETLQFRAPGGAWHATLTPTGMRYREGEAPADETIEDPDLLLVLNRRVAPATTPGPIFTRWLATTRF
jgi:uncharacterized protein (TIGR03083 family)